ncbi:hypothetical protein [Embleya scabrispora]|uniref:hypothetical protein n=1 Tax=Embleya scabrispora TaxID=159449 RepID=UPI00117CCEFA|nr:hypothetical protein [Embleya scabrispora]
MHGTSGVDLLLPKSTPAPQPNVISPAQQHALLLHPGMRQRLRRAVDALVLDNRLMACSVGARLALLVVAAKSNWEDGCIAHISRAELGRWLGVTPRTAHDYLDELRIAHALVTEPHYDSQGTVVGLWCALPEMVGVRCLEENPTHPLALTRGELATLLRLLEHLIGPGWLSTDGTGTPPGLLATRRGRGAATDRLAFVLLALRTGTDGRIRQRGGRFSGRRGRMAATLRALLGCTDAGAENVLSRLADRGVVRRNRRTMATGLRHRTDWLVPAIARAHRPSEPLPRPRRCLTHPKRREIVHKSPGQTQHQTRCRTSPGTRCSFTLTHDHTALGDVSLHACDPMVFSAKGESTPTDTSRESSRNRPGALRAENPRLRFPGESTDVRVVFAAIPSVVSRFTPGQRATAARALQLVLRGPSALTRNTWFWNAELLAAHFSMRLPLRPNIEIRSALGWFLSQLPESIAICRYCRRTTHGAPSSRRTICGVCLDDGATPTSPPAPANVPAHRPSPREGFTLPDWAREGEPEPRPAHTPHMSPGLAAAISHRQRSTTSPSDFDRYRLAEEQRWLTRITDLHGPVGRPVGAVDRPDLGVIGGFRESTSAEELVGLVEDPARCGAAPSRAGVAR